MRPAPAAQTYAALHAQASGCDGGSLARPLRLLDATRRSGLLAHRGCHRRRARRWCIAASRLIVLMQWSSSPFFARWLVHGGPSPLSLCANRARQNALRGVVWSLRQFRWVLRRNLQRRFGGHGMAPGRRGSFRSGALHRLTQIRWRDRRWRFGPPQLRWQSA
jgi:hypothetical protein